MTEFCDEHSGHKANIRELCDFKKDTMRSSTGTIDRLWTAVEKKASKGLVVTSIIIIVGLMSTLFGLVYKSNIDILHEMAGIKSNVALINEKLK